MEKYSLAFASGSYTWNGNGKIKCVCNRGETGCPTLNFEDIQSLYNFLKSRISSFDEFEIDQIGIIITWHEKNGETHLVRSARIEFTQDLRKLVNADLFNIQCEYRQYRESMNFLKVRCMEELQKFGYVYDNDMPLSYCERILKVYADYGKIDVLYDKESNRRFLNFLKVNRDNFIAEKNKKITEEENKANKKNLKITGCTAAINGCLIALFLHSPLYLIMLLLGTIITSSLCQEYFNKNHYAKIEEYKKSIAKYQKLIEDLEVSIENTKNDRHCDEQEFYNFIKQDIDYMNTNPNEDYTDLLAQINKLQQSYASDILLRRNINIYEYLIALAYLEIDIYSKDTGIGLKPQCECPINRETILKRLNLMGFERVATYGQETHLTTLLESVDRILNTPFVGCEAELARLNRIAIDYAHEVLNRIQQTEEFDATAIDDVIRQGQNENFIVSSKLQKAEQYQHLCDLMSDLEAHLATDPNMNVDKGMTVTQ